MARVEPKFVVAFGLGAAAATMGVADAALLAWPAVSFGVVALAYAGLGPWPFGKRASGRMHPVATVVLAPYLVVAWLVLLLLRLGREAGHHEVRPRLFLGRRPLRASELPEGVSLIVDLTSEFPGFVRRVQNTSVFRRSTGPRRRTSRRRAPSSSASVCTTASCTCIALRATAGPPRSSSACS